MADSKAKEDPFVQAAAELAERNKTLEASRAAYVASLEAMNTQLKVTIDLRSAQVNTLSGVLNKAVNAIRTLGGDPVVLLGIEEHKASEGALKPPVDIAQAAGPSPSRSAKASSKSAPSRKPVEDDE